MRFDDKIVLVTGGASGIGLATCYEFAKAGAQVILTDEDALRRGCAAEMFEANNLRVCSLELDATKRDSINAAIDWVKSERGKIHVLINAAGWDVVEPFTETTLEYWEKPVALNILVPYR